MCGYLTPDYLQHVVRNAAIEGGPQGHVTANSEQLTDLLSLVIQTSIMILLNILAGQDKTSADQ